MNRPPPSVESSVRATARLLALLLAVLLIIPASLAHRLLVRHAVCEVHGDLLHEAESGAESNVEQVGAAVDASAVGRVGFGPAVNESASSEHDHEHCAFASEGRERTLVGRAVVEVTLDRDVGPGSGVIEATALPATGEHLYRFAPKTSPPA